MAKTKPAPKPVEPDFLMNFEKGELFVKRSFIRECRARYAMPESEASNEFLALVDSGRIKLSKTHNEINIYEKAA